MKDNTDEFLDEFDRTIDVRLYQTGLIVRDAIKAEIGAQGLVDTERMIDDIRFEKEGKEVRIGSTITERSPYPVYLNAGFIHARSGQLVGPFRFMEGGFELAEPSVRELWQEMMEGPGPAR